MRWDKMPSEPIAALPTGAPEDLSDCVRENRVIFTKTLGIWCPTFISIPEPRRVILGRSGQFPMYDGLVAEPCWTYPAALKLRHGISVLEFDVQFEPKFLSGGVA